MSRIDRSHPLLRWAGPLVAAVGQLTLGFAGARSVHVCWGVLSLCGVTPFCSYTSRELPAHRTRVSAKLSDH